MKTRLPVQIGLLELLLFEIQRHFSSQIYFEKMYLAMFSLGYYGLFRVGELTQSMHVIKVPNVHIALNKEKILVVLYSSKTHDESMRPQKVKITANKNCNMQLHFCPFKIINDYFRSRCKTDRSAQFFVFSDGSLVIPMHACTLLRTLLDKLGLNSALYDMHSLCIGRASDLIHKFQFSLEQVRILGRWQSNIVYRYIRQ